MLTALHRAYIELPEDQEQGPERDGESARRERARRLFVAFMLAPSIEICEVLLRGESVPVDRLDAEWVARFGRRGS